MSFNFTHKEYMKRKKLSRKAAVLEDALNSLISDSFKMGLGPDISIDFRANLGRPIIKISFFKDSDAIQN